MCFAEGCENWGTLRNSIYFQVDVVVKYSEL